METNQKLSEKEFSQMLTLIKRHAVTDMDQFSTWKLNSERGDIYVCLSNAPLAADENVHKDLSHLVKA
ncbi:hypothetical protein H4J38_09265 [Colwellia sp. BRX10-3]|jgi:hypothetical protein|uniref:hypothetical protein n=1 Tax=unclassified Colwellia TaxID=196834 RepID=UPI0015F5B279|nr:MULTISPECIES: hypothetical protein [unclassified Colwellia]MBA6231378.1 hypothetical protein [Colwellia sp. MB02u-7]MBA6235615.1 hypothetical protein [Colwellia sp. MB02u-11]MBA6297978.1 hypothetical protein [Colwellia sp. MB3u-22]MBA6303130.1 hypothetical protein [Colwellia sp. MB02u-14]MBA6309398.1 hypothetical protein [Colwellia sp. MB3u-64]